MAMDCDTYIAIDTETSGLGSDAQVLEVSVMHYWRGRVVRRWSALVCPMNLSWEDEKVKEAMAINKLSIEALMYGAETFEKMHQRFEQEVSEPIWVMHNASFDMRMLHQEYTRLGLPFPEPSQVFCTKKLDALIHPEGKERHLYNLCERYGVVNASPHRAFGDAQACGDIFAKMLEVLPSKFEDLLEMYRRDTPLSWFNATRSKA